jgi:hypothetical protein
MSNTEGASGIGPLVLSVRQPYATAIVLGMKDVENRGWRPPFAPPFRLLIHATARSDPRWRDSPQAGLIAQIRPASLWKSVHSLIVGVATVADIVADSTSPWANPAARFKWLLTDAAVLDDPVPAAGRLHLWPAPPEITWAAGGRNVPPHDQAATQ